MPGAAEPGGVPFDASLMNLARANLWLRTASRVLARVTAFHVRALGELERKAKTIPWREWLPPKVAVELRVTSKKSRLYHQKAIAERIAAGIVAAGWTVTTGREEPEGDDDAVEPAELPQLVVVRVFRDECTISLDSSGALLHRRGYRLATAKAPLRETLAAALVYASGWDPASPLIDPMCGSGTIPIEAALLARRMAPGRHRRFACERWPGWDPGAWTRVLADADAGTLPQVAAPILGADRDAGAIRAARANAERAGVAGDITFREAAISMLVPPAGTGVLVSNPPYGVRVGERGPLRDLFARLGQVVRERLPGWSVTLLLTATPLERETRLSFHEAFATSNGGLRVRGLTTLNSNGGGPT